MTNQIEKTIELKAPVDRVWLALTDSAEFGAWFRVKLEDPFAPGELSRGHITHPGYEHLVWEARVVRMEARRLFSFTWHPYAVDPNMDYSGEPSTLVEFRLEEIGSGTRLTITESGFDALPAHRRDEALRMNDGGWSAQTQNIAAHVQS
ncbi:MAG TPA: SRPBCC family protein [Caulobacteraceae bacterium]|jgi:uncharacterized protein YndB with AHSA1/START domain|nr:SRPBCC family protein [Caulobacteraceae bacterium]